MDTIKINKKNTQMVAHAGLFGLETANTGAGFIAAGNRSYWGVECDVRVAKDGLVVMHNDSTEGFAPETVIMSESTVEQIQSVMPQAANSPRIWSRTRICSVGTGVLDCPRARSRVRGKIRGTLSRPCHPERSEYFTAEQ